MGPDGRKMHASSYFRNVPHLLPTVLGYAVLGKNQAGRRMVVYRLLLGSRPGGAAALGLTAQDLPPVSTTVEWQLLLTMSQGSYHDNV